MDVEGAVAVTLMWVLAPHIKFYDRVILFDGHSNVRQAVQYADRSC